MDIYTDIVEHTKELIKNELDQIDCERVADYNGYSVKQMNRIFTVQTQMSIGEYINYKRLAQAIMDLRYTNLSIIQIAQKNGYATQESFTRAIKKAFQVTPYRFRKEHSWNIDPMEEKLIEIIEETSHETARQEKVELPKPTVSFMQKKQSLWYSIQRNTKDLFPHNFYVQCQKNGEYERIHQTCGNHLVGGAYLTHIYRQQKFTSLTLGFEMEYKETNPYYEGVRANIMPASSYMVVNVPTYKNYELGTHVLAAWNVFSEFDYKKHGLQRNLDQAPIYEWDSPIDGYTLFFPIKYDIGGRI